MPPTSISRRSPKATDLQKRIWFTLIALVVYRIGTFIPIPGIDPAAFANAFQQQAGGILGMFNTFSGGAVERMAIFALNVMPYISASIIMQLMATSVPSLERLKKEGEVGRKQINQYTRYLTLVLALVQSYGIAIGLSSSPGVVINPGIFFVASTVITLTGGTMFLMWLGEQVTARGVGNGISLIIFAGIVAEMPRVIMSTLAADAHGRPQPVLVVLLVVVMLAVIVFIVFMERSQRRLVVQYPKRQQGNRMFMGESSFLPLKINTAGVIPPIFASSLLLLPTTIIGFAGMQDEPAGMDAGVRALYRVRPAGPHGALRARHHLLLLLLHLDRVQSGRDGRQSAQVRRLPAGHPSGQADGGISGLRADAPDRHRRGLHHLRLLAAGNPDQRIRVPFYLGGTSILIVISVTMDTVAQIQSHLVAHQYEGLIKRSKLRGSAGPG